MLLKDISEYSGIYLARGATDMRRSVDGLAHIVKQDFQMDPFESNLYLFSNKRRNRLKVLHWDSNGFCIYYKRLDGEGAKFAWPKKPGEVMNLSIEQLKRLLSGLSPEIPQGFGEITARDF